MATKSVLEQLETQVHRNIFLNVNAAGVLQVPVLISIWDDRWGISVPSKYQTTKEDISQLLKAFKKLKN